MSFQRFLDRIAQKRALVLTLRNSGRFQEAAEVEDAIRRTLRMVGADLEAEIGRMERERRDRTN